MAKLNIGSYVCFLFNILISKIIDWSSWEIYSSSVDKVFYTSIRQVSMSCSSGSLSSSSITAMQSLNMQSLRQSLDNVSVPNGIVCCGADCKEVFAILRDASLANSD
jgi:hypothetical protein